jgi:hypothetical protein
VVVKTAALVATLATGVAQAAQTAQTAIRDGDRWASARAPSSRRN